MVGRNSDAVIRNRVFKVWRRTVPGLVMLVDPTPGSPPDQNTRTDYLWQFPCSAISYFPIKEAVPPVYAPLNIFRNVIRYFKPRNDFCTSATELGLTVNTRKSGLNGHLYCATRELLTGQQYINITCLAGWQYFRKLTVLLSPCKTCNIYFIIPKIILKITKNN